jgi:hypothetical protein
VIRYGNRQNETEAVAEAVERYPLSQTARARGHILDRSGLFSEQPGDKSEQKVSRKEQQMKKELVTEPPNLITPNPVIASMQARIDQMEKRFAPPAEELLAYAVGDIVCSIADFEASYLGVVQNFVYGEYRGKRTRRVSVVFEGEDTPREFPTGSIVLASSRSLNPKAFAEAVKRIQTRAQARD